MDSSSPNPMCSAVEIPGGFSGRVVVVPKTLGLLRDGWFNLCTLVPFVERRDTDEVRAGSDRGCERTVVVGSFSRSRVLRLFHGRMRVSMYPGATQGMNNLSCLCAQLESSCQ